MMNDNEKNIDNKNVEAAAAENAKDPKEAKDTSAVESVNDIKEVKDAADSKETAVAENDKEKPEADAAEKIEEESKEIKDTAVEKSAGDTPKSEDVKPVDNANTGHARRQIIASVFESAKNEQKSKETSAAENVKDAQKAADDNKDVKSPDVSNTREKIIVAAVLLAGAWSVFFAVFGKTPPNVVSLKNSASELAAQNSPKNKTTKAPNKKYKKAKDFTLTDLDGKIVKLSGFKGKTVFIDFWASWCPPCKMSIPAVKKLHDKMKNNPNVVVISINCWEEKKKAVNFIKKEGINYPVLFSDGVVEKDYNVSSIPRFFIIDGDGNIINEYSGWHPSYAANWERDINEAFSEKQGESAAQQQPPLSDLDGNAVNIASYKGKTLFLAFWVMQSYACVKAQPAFNAMHNKISKTANAEFIGVNTDTQQSLLKAFIKDNNIKYPVLRATQSFADSYSVSSITPACVIIDKNGKPVKTFFGYSDGDEKEWAQAFNEAVKAK